MQFTKQTNKEEIEHFSPGLYIVSTPIGNLEDITFRAIKVLKKSDIILCEDTRWSKKLLFHYKIKNKLIAYHKFNEKKVSNKIINLIKSNKIVSLISDAGTPTISDPGSFLIKATILEKLQIYPIPGPSAVTAAFSASGFEDKYLFYGFLPKKENELNKLLQYLKNINFNIIFFAPSNKINFYLHHFKKYFLNRDILIAKEITKLHEAFIRGKVDTIADFTQNLRGELTIVISKNILLKKNAEEISESVKLDIEKMLTKYTHKDVVDFISKKENLPKKLVYNFCLNIKKQK